MITIKLQNCATHYYDAGNDKVHPANPYWLLTICDSTGTSLYINQITNEQLHKLSTEINNLAEKYPRINQSYIENITLEKQVNAAALCPDDEIPHDITNPNKIPDSLWDSGLDDPKGSLGLILETREFTNIPDKLKDGCSTIDLLITSVGLPQTSFSLEGAPDIKPPTENPCNFMHILLAELAKLGDETTPLEVAMRKELFGETAFSVDSPSELEEEKFSEAPTSEIPLTEEQEYHLKVMCEITKMLRDGKISDFPSLPKKEQYQLLQTLINFAFLEEQKSIHENTYKLIVCTVGTLVKNSPGLLLRELTTAVSDMMCQLELDTNLGTNSITIPDITTLLTSIQNELSDMKHIIPDGLPANYDGDEITPDLDDTLPEDIHP